MCGGCGARTDVDWASALLGSAPARSAAARVVRAAAGRAVDVRAAAGGWTVRRPTGGGLVVGTLSALVGAVGPRPDAGVDLPEVPGACVPEPDRRRPVVVVHGTPPGPHVVDAGAAGWADRLLAGPPGPAVVAVPVVVAASGDPGAVLHALLGDPLRRHVRVTGLESPALPGWGAVTGPLPGVPDRVLPTQVPALAALLAVRLSGRPPGERTRTRVAVGGTAVVLDALGPVVLGAGRVDPSAQAASSAAQAGAGPRPSRHRAASSDGL